MRSRIIYVTGMKPKPPPEPHRQALVRVLDNALQREAPALAGWLDSRPEHFELVSWTALLYEEQRDIALDLPGIDRLLERDQPTPEDIQEIDRFGRRVARAWHLLGDSYPWLTGLVANDALRQTLAEVHRYLDDRDGIGKRIRTLVRERLIDAWAAGERVMLIGHSLGSVLCYDALWELCHEDRLPGAVDMFLSLGSPIATRFIRLQLKGADRDGEARYPGNPRRWLNVSARGELVALHPRIEPYFGAMQTQGVIESVVDREIYNHFRGTAGLDVHKSYGYLHHPIVAGAIAEWIGAAG